MDKFIGFLYARPSFIEGVARIFDFSGSLNTYNTSSTPSAADYRAIYRDWEIVGQDLDGAIKTVGREIQVPT